MWYRFCKKKYSTAIVALCFKPESIKRLKIKHDLPKKDIVGLDEYHVTMMYLGELSDLKKDRATIEKSLLTLAQKYTSFKLTIGGVAKFFTDGDKAPYVFTVNAPEIESLRKDVVASMNSIGIEEPEGSPDFIPHMTLGFTEPKENLNSISLKNDELDVEGIHLSWGGDPKLFKFKD